MVMKWKLSNWNTNPEQVEVVSETGHFATVRERAFFANKPDKFYVRRMKKDGTIYDTFEEVKAAMVKSAEVKVSNEEEALQRAKDWLKECRELKDPTGERK